MPAALRLGHERHDPRQAQSNARSGQRLAVALIKNAQDGVRTPGCSEVR